MNNTETILRTNHFPAYVLASAGTGKTEIISRKVEDLIINKGVDSEAKDIKDRSPLNYAEKSLNMALLKTMNLKKNIPE